MNLFIINYLILIEIGVLKWTNVCAHKVLLTPVKISCPYFSHSDDQQRNESFRPKEITVKGWKDDGDTSQSIRISSDFVASNAKNVNGHPYKLSLEPHQLPYMNHGSHQNPSRLLSSYLPLVYPETLNMTGPMKDSPHKVANEFNESAGTNRGENTSKFPKRTKGRVEKRKKHSNSKRAGAMKSLRTTPIMCSGSHFITEPIASPSQTLINQQPIQWSLSQKHPNEPDTFKSSKYKVLAKPFRVKKVCVRNRCKNVIFTGLHNPGLLRTRGKNFPVRGNKEDKNWNQIREQNSAAPNTPPNIDILPPTLQNNAFHHQMANLGQFHSTNSTEHNSSIAVDYTASDSFTSPQRLPIYSVTKLPQVKNSSLQKLTKNRKQKKKKIILLKTRKEPPQPEGYDENVPHSAIRYINTLTSAHFGGPSFPKSESKPEYRQPVNMTNVFNYSNKTFRYDNTTPKMGPFENDSAEWKPALGRDPIPEDQTQWLPVPSFLKTHSKSHFSNVSNFETDNEVHATNPQLSDNWTRVQNHAQEDRSPKIIPAILWERETRFVPLQTQSTEKSNPLQNMTAFDLTAIDKYVEDKVKETINRQKQNQLQQGKTSGRFKRKTSLTSAEVKSNEKTLYEKTHGRTQTRFTRNEPSERKLQLTSNQSENLKLHGTKRPLARLRGLDFLTRYEKKKSKLHSEKVSDFWAVSNTNESPHKSLGFDKKFVPEATTRLHKNPPDESKKSLKQSQTSSTDTINSDFREREQKGFHLGKPVKDTGELRIIVTEPPPPPPSPTPTPPKTTLNPTILIKIKPNKYRISLREKVTKSQPTILNKKPKHSPLSEVTSKIPNYHKLEVPSSQPATIKDNSSTEKYSQTDQNTFFTSQTPKYNSIPRNHEKTLIIIQDSKEVTSPRPYYRDFRPSFEEIDQIPTNSTTEENAHFTHKTPHYNSILRTHETAKSPEGDISSLFSTTPTSFHGYLIPSRKPIESDERLQTNKPQQNYDNANIPRKPSRYSTISRNRESWRNKPPEEVITSERPSYGEFEKTYATTEADEITESSTTGTTPEKEENETIRTSDPSNETWGVSDDGSTPYDNGPVLYYIVNEKTGRGRWISYPSEKHIQKLKNLKKTVQNLVEGN